MIDKEYLVSVVSIALVVQLCFAVPVLDDDPKSSEEKKDIGNLKQFAAKEFDKVAANIVPKEIDILKAVLKDLKNNDTHTDAENEVISEIEEFLKFNDENAERSDTTASELFFRIHSIVEPTDENTANAAVKRSRKRLLSLQQHDWSNVRQQFDAEIVPKIDELDKKVNDYYDKLTEDEKKNKKGVAKWIQQYKDKENDVGDKLNLLLNFIVGLDDDSNESNKDEN